MATFALLTLMVVKCPVGICPTIYFTLHGHSQMGKEGICYQPNQADTIKIKHSFIQLSSLHFFNKDESSIGAV